MLRTEYSKRLFFFFNIVCKEKLDRRQGREEVSSSTIMYSVLLLVGQFFITAE